MEITVGYVRFNPNIIVSGLKVGVLLHTIFGTPSKTVTFLDFDQEYDLHFSVKITMSASCLFCESFERPKLARRWIVQDGIRC